MNATSENPILSWHGKREIETNETPSRLFVRVFMVQLNRIDGVPELPDTQTSKQTDVKETHCQVPKNVGEQHNNNSNSSSLIEKTREKESDRADRLSAFSLLRLTAMVLCTTD